jgi:hypothetical protein
LLLPFKPSLLDKSRLENIARIRLRDAELKQRKDDRHDRFHTNIEAIRSGSAHPKILNDLAESYFNPEVKADLRTECRARRKAQRSFYYRVAFATPPCASCAPQTLSI